METLKASAQSHLSNNRKFFKSPNFDGWYRHRHKEMSQKLESVHLEVICDAVSHWEELPAAAASHLIRLESTLEVRFAALQDLLGWTRDKSEVEIVDLVLKIREKVVSFSHLVPASSDLTEYEQEVCFSE